MMIDETTLTQEELAAFMQLAGSLGELRREVSAVEDAAYAFMRHIQDQIEHEAGWIQFDYYNPEIDAYAYNKFCEALGSKDHAKSSELLRRFTVLTSHKESE